MPTVVIMGGGAAGFFAAIACAGAASSPQVILLEKTNQLLSKVRISGGGRCNVTHACFEPKILVQNYPRGGKELIGPFNRFQPKDTIQWFESRDVLLKTEEDGRMFPVTDSSQTIIDCLQAEAKKSGVEVRLKTGVENFERTEKGFLLHLSNGETISCDRLLIATGSNRNIYETIANLGHTIIPLVPSLFTFNVPTSPLLELAGISVEKALVKIANTPLEQTGPLLITHWGFSGPAILKLSAWGARILHDLNYHATLIIDWLPDFNLEMLRKTLSDARQQYPERVIANESLFGLPRNLWKKLTTLAGISQEQRWATLSNKSITSLADVLHANSYQIEGKTTYKQEFVTCGGIKLDEVNFKTMESRICPGLYFAGEVLDIDGVTGGFNFQNAWTTGWIAGNAIGSYNP